MCGMLLIALTPESRDPQTITIKLCGTMLASVSSGLGELSFLGLTHYYGKFSLAAWGSGTGGAGLVGAGAYVIATTSLGLSVRTSLLTFSFLPVIMLISFFGILPLEPLRHSALAKPGGYESIEQEEEQIADEEDERTVLEHDPLMSTSMHSSRSFGARSTSPALSTFQTNLQRASKLFFP
jgi:battenin